MRVAVVRAAAGRISFETCSVDCGVFLLTKQNKSLVSLLKNTELGAVQAPHGAREP